MTQLFDEFKEYIITGVISFITGVIAYIQGKRKSTAETEIVETDVVKSIRELYAGLVEDMKSTIQDLKDAREKLDLITKEMVTLRSDLKLLEKELEDCRNNKTE